MSELGLKNQAMLENGCQRAQIMLRMTSTCNQILEDHVWQELTTPSTSGSSAGPQEPLRSLD